MNRKYFDFKNFIIIIMAFVCITCVHFFVKNVEAVGNDINNETVINISEEEGKNSNSEGIFDTKALEGIYKVSEDKLGYLPFIRYALDRIIVDEKISGMGVLFSATNIEVNSPITGLQVLFANDTVRINSNMEYGVVFSASNTVIDGTIDKPIIVLSGDNITISENAVLNSDIICYSNSLTVLGKVKGSVLGAVNSVKVDGSIEKDLRIQTTIVEVKNEKSILGNVYVETYNKDINIKNIYPNANLKVLENTVDKLSYEVVMNSIITCLLFTLIYLILNRKTNGKIFEHAKTKVKDNVIFVILSGSIVIITLPAVVFALIILSLIGLHAITVPLIIVYIAGVLIISLLSTLIVGCLLASYMENNYFKDKSKTLKALGTFFVFLSLQILTKLQYIGIYVTMALILLSVGITMAYIFKKNNKIVNKVEEIK